MYFVINKTNPPRPLVVSDIKLELQPRQAIDLDKTSYTREQLNKSKDLAVARKAGLIKIQITENKKAKAKPTAYVGLNEDQIRAGVREEIKEQMSALTEAIKAGSGSPKEDSEEMKAILKQLSAAIASGQMGSSVTHVHQGGKEEFVDDNEGVDPVQLGSIHAKAVDRLAKGVEGKIEVQAKEVPGGSVQDRASELDDLLGE